MKSLGAIIKQLHAMVGGRDFTEWENDFVKSITETTDGGASTTRLTEKQVARIERLYRQHFGDS